ncbi:Inhibitory POU protein [Frankliniella fusca]|uniref:Inhibitory POU protein n=1 Tax=Frankliniella fusca TaxID=407009 RepID=A0AAE1HGV4_9NEOP|nr:Inhibitory POU protein [Frankliniella fusca]
MTGKEGGVQRLERGDLFSGLNDGLLSRAEALDIGKHQGQPIKHDMMYHHAMPPHNPRTHQVSRMQRVLSTSRFDTSPA